MVCGSKEAGGVYRPRQPQQSPFYQLVERLFAQFEAVYEERYQERYGVGRPIIGTSFKRSNISCAAPFPRRAGSDQAAGYRP